ncbi:MAG: hypothetical protein JW727_05010 [Candidatus Aenigmarchaeota archaeon]|nr:hypothetical protein [Candidatus Aenigmarchaeota archaeon]
MATRNIEPISFIRKDYGDASLLRELSSRSKTSSPMTVSELQEQLNPGVFNEIFDFPGTVIDETEKTVYLPSRTLYEKIWDIQEREDSLGSKGLIEKALFYRYSPFRPINYLSRKIIEKGEKSIPVNITLEEISKSHRKDNLIMNGTIVPVAAPALYIPYDPLCGAMALCLSSAIGKLFFCYFVARDATLKARESKYLAEEVTDRFGDYIVARYNWRFQKNETPNHNRESEFSYD